MQTKDYLSSPERKLADRLIVYQMNHRLTQQQVADVLGISLNMLLLVEFNHPKATPETYSKVAQLFQQLER